MLGLKAPGRTTGLKLWKMLMIARIVRTLETFPAEELMINMLTAVG
jgi:hypothetical protein